VEVRFHVVPGARVTADGPRGCTITLPGRGVRVVVDAPLTVSLVTAPDAPVGGWVSRRYHDRQPATTIVARAGTQGRAVLVTRITWGPAGP
jgi:hypothetical protein